MTRLDRSRKRILGMALCAVTIFFACSDSDDVSAPGGHGPARLALAPRYALLAGAHSVGEPINRIRLTARVQPTGEVVGTLVTEVDPTAQSWNLGLDVTISAEIRVVVTVELINVANGVEAVQWSGVTDPITVAPSSPTQTAVPVVLFQGPPANLDVVSLTLSAESITLEEGASSSLTATVNGPSGALVIWGTDDPSVATVDQSGAIAGIRPGATRVIAVAGPRADTAHVNVTQRVTAVTVAPDTQRIQSIGAEAAFTARALDARNTDITGAAVTWSAADSSIAQHIGGGRFRALANGTTQIFATSVARPSVRGTATFVVAQRAATVDIDPATASLSSIGARRTFTASVRDANGNPVTHTVTWRSTNAAVATIDASGTATATGAGITEISALAGTGADTVVGHATLDVTQAPAVVVVRPDAATLESIGQTLEMEAVVTDANGVAIPGAVPQWSSSAAAVATVDNAGLVRATANGSATITAQIGGIQGAATIDVRQKTATVQITPASDTVVGNDTVRFVAIARDALNEVIAGALFTWTSADTTVATVDNTGLILGRRAGTTTISAQNGGITASASLLVRSAGPTRLVITPDSARINAIGFSTRLVAVAYDDFNSPLPLAAITWSTLDPAIASVDSTGTVRAIAPGRGRIVASVNPADTVVVVVQQIAATITLSALGATATVGDSVQVTAAVSDSNDVSINSAVVTWSSSDTTVAKVSATGFITAIREGAAIIHAATAGHSASLPFTATAPDLTLVSFTIVPDTIAAATGDSTVVTLKVRNAGSGPSGPTPINLALVDATTNTVLIDSTFILPGIVAGDTFTLSKPLFANFAAPVDSLYARATLGEAVLRSNVLYLRYGVEAVVATPDTITLSAIGDTVRISVALLDRFGRPVSGQTVSYQVPDSMIVKVDASGLVTALGLGSTYVKASTQTRLDSVLVQVSQNAVQLNISPPSADLIIGDTVRATATALDARGDIIPNVSAIWHSNRPAVAMVDPSGLITAVTVDTATIFASYGGLSIGTSVNVRGANLTFRAGSVVVTPAVAQEGGAISLTGVILNVGSAVAGPSTVALRALSVAGDTVIFSTTVPLDSIRAGDSLTVVYPLPIDTLFNWPDSVRGEATLNSSGVVRESNGADNTAITQVIPVRFRVDSLQVTTPIVLGAIADTARIQVTLLDRKNRELHDRLIEYESSNPLSISVDTTGLATALRADSAYIIVKAETRVDSVRVIVSQIASSLLILDGNRQTATVNQEATQLLAVKVLDANGNGVAGADVTWHANDDAAIIASRGVPATSIGFMPAVMPPMVSRTDAQGIATVKWKLRTVAGPDTVRACLASAPCVVFEGHARAGKAKRADKKPGVDDQDVIVNRIATNAAELTVLDEFGNPTRGTVEWSLESTGHGRLPSGDTTETTVVDTLTGKATIQWTMPIHKGQYSLRYKVMDEAGDSVAGGNFRVNAKPDKPKNANKTIGSDDQLVTVAQTAANALELTVEDEFGNAIEGANVEYSLGAGQEGSLMPARSTTDVNGKASTTWSVGTKAATKLVVHYLVKRNDTTFAADSFRARVRADKATKANKKPGVDDQDVIVNRIAPNAAELTVLDNFDNPTRGTVEWSLESTGHGRLPSGDTTETTVVDTLTGKATIQWTMPIHKGQYSLHYKVMDETDDSVAGGSFRVNAKPDKPKKSVKTAGADSQTVTVFTQLGNALEVTVKDTFDNVIEGAVVEWSLREPNSLEGSLTAEKDTTDADGRASVGWIFGKNAGAFFVNYSIHDTDGSLLDSASFKATGNPGPKAMLKAFKGAVSDSVGVDALNDKIRVTAKTYDLYGNERTGDVVTWSKAPGETKVDIFGDTVVTRLNGKAIVTATSGSVSGSLILGIDQQITELSITGGADALTADTLTALQFGKRVNHTQMDRKQTSVDFSRFLAQVTWRSSNPAILTITEDADSIYATSIANGLVYVLATVDADTMVRDSVFISVKQAVSGSTIDFALPGGTTFTSAAINLSAQVTMVARALDAKQRPVRNWQWTSADPSKLQIVSSSDSTVTVTGISVTTAGPIQLIVRDPKGSMADTLLITVVSTGGLSKAVIEPILDPRQGEADKSVEGQMAFMTPQPKLWPPGRIKGSWDLRL